MEHPTKRRPLAYGAVAASLIILFYIFLHVESFPLHESTRSCLKELLTDTKEFKASKGDSDPERAAIYVMGGGQFNLGYRFRVAADLYLKYPVEKILIMSRPGITEYDPSLERNLTNDEWAIKILTGIGVKARDIEPLKMNEHFLGTLGESREVRKIAAGRRYKTLFVVTSMPHTKRVLLTFSRALEGTGVKLYVYGSDDPVGLEALLVELVKLEIYRLILSL